MYSLNILQSIAMGLDMLELVWVSIIEYEYNA